MFLVPFLLLPLLFSSVSSSKQISDYYRHCKDPYLFPCGSQNYRISYPFTVSGDREICGPPDYRLTCRDHNGERKLTIKINDQDFQVLRISYDDRSITVAEQDVVVDQNVCNVKYDDSTHMDPDLFELTPQDANLTLYSCPSFIVLPPSPWQPLSLLPCSLGCRCYLAFAPIEDQSLLSQLLMCKTTTVVIKQPAIGGLQSQPSAKSLQDALQQGFDIKWKAGGSWCDQCLHSGGTCGYNTSAPLEHICYCFDSSGKGGVSKGRCTPLWRSAHLQIVVTCYYYKAVPEHVPAAAVAAVGYKA